MDEKIIVKVKSLLRRIVELAIALTVVVLLGIIIVTQFMPDLPPAISHFVDRQFVSWAALKQRARCIAVKGTTIPDQDRAPAKIAEYLANCQSEKLYIGDGPNHPPDKTMARYCAIAEMDRHSSSYMRQSVLILLYTTGDGVTQNFALAEHIACLEEDSMYGIQEKSMGTNEFLAANYRAFRKLEKMKQPITLSIICNDPETSRLQSFGMCNPSYNR